MRYYFDGRAELIVEAYRQFKRNALDFYLENAANEGPDPACRLKALIQAVFFYNSEDTEQLRIWTGFLEPMLTDPKISATHAESNDRIIKEICECVTGIYAKRGESITPETANKLALGIKSMVDGLWLECSFNPARLPPAKALEIALDLIGPRLGISLSK